MSESADREVPSSPSGSPSSSPLASQLAGARMPADRGLSGLGLVMQLGGSVFAALTAMLGFLQLISLAELRSHYGGAGSSMLWVLALTAVGIVRSAAHRSAGIGLLYGERPACGVRRYIGIAAMHTLLVVGFLVAVGEAPLGVVLSFGLALAAWPGILAVVVLRVLRPCGGDGALAMAEDKGFEGAAVLMTLLGTCGALFAAMTLIGLVELPGSAMATGPGVFLLVILVMLLVRSVLQVHAGWRGLHEVHIDRAVEATNRYADFAVITAFAAAGIFLVILMMQQAGVQGLVYISGMAWLLLAWPLALRRFYGERQFADLLAGENAPVHRRAPDRGLTALGWLLLAIGGVGLALYLPAALLPAGNDVLTSIAGEPLARSPWWNVGTHALALWAGLELVRMTDHHRLAATVFGVVATAVNVYQYLPALRSLEGVAAYASPGASSVVGLGQLALSLVPIASVLLVNRVNIPVARARMRARR